MYSKIKDDLAQELKQIKDDGLYKDEWEITTPQNASIQVKGEKTVVTCGGKKQCAIFATNLVAVFEVAIALAVLLIEIPVVAE